jgi:abhydrolase domain-containing protein 6
MRRLALALPVLLLLLLVSGCSMSTKEGIVDSFFSWDRSLSNLTPRTVDVDGLPVNFLERPGTGDTIVFIHGFGGNKDNWNRLVRYLPPDYRIIALDLPGHGDNPKPLDRTYTIDYFTGAFARDVDALKLGRFHLAGNSMGGYVAILYTARNPDRVIDLCLMDSASIFKAGQQPSDAQVELSQGRNPLIPETTGDFNVLMDYLFYRKPFMPWPVKPVLAAKAVESASFAQKIFRDLVTDPVDPLPLLPGLRMPVLVIWGDHDRILHVSTTEVLGKYLPNREIVILKDCGHVPMIERPKETARYYADFLGRRRDKG